MPEKRKTGRPRGPGRSRPPRPAEMPEEVFKKTLGASLRGAREAAGLTLQQLAEAAGVPFQSLWGYEQGIHAIRLDTFLLVCHALGIEPASVLPGARATAKGAQGPGQEVSVG